MVVLGGVAIYFERGTTVGISHPHGFKVPSGTIGPP